MREYFKRKAKKKTYGYHKHFHRNLLDNNMKVYLMATAHNRHSFGKQHKYLIVEKRKLFRHPEQKLVYRIGNFTCSITKLPLRIKITVRILTTKC